MFPISDFDVLEITPLGSEPVVSIGLPCWFDELSGFVEYISPVLSRRFESA